MYNCKFLDKQVATMIIKTRNSKNDCLLLVLFLVTFADGLARTSTDPGSTQPLIVEDEDAFRTRFLQTLPQP